MTNVQTTRWLGAHVSASGGLDLAVDRALAIGANCVQVFSGSPRVWARKSLAELDLQKFYSKVKENNFGPIITHALYLLNLASENPELVAKSVQALDYDLEFDALVKGSGVVVHLGSHQGRGWAAARDQVRDKMAGLLSNAPSVATFLIENSAGQQGKLASDLEDIRWLFNELQAPNLGWCFDTCHGWAAGYALNRQAPKSAANEFDRLDLWEKLKVIHVNDSRDAFGSARDRHANVGEGLIPTEDLRAFLTEPLLKDIPLILEVPGVDHEGPDRDNMERLKALVSAA